MRSGKGRGLRTATSPSAREVDKFKFAGQLDLSLLHASRRELSFPFRWGGEIPSPWEFSSEDPSQGSAVRENEAASIECALNSHTRTFA